MSDSYEILRYQITRFREHISEEDISLAFVSNMADFADRLLKALIKADGKIEELRGEIDEFRHDHGYEKREWETEE